MRRGWQPGACFYQATNDYLEMGRPCYGAYECSTRKARGRRYKMERMAREYSVLKYEQVEYESVCVRILRKVVRIPVPSRFLKQSEQKQKYKSYTRVEFLRSQSQAEDKLVHQKSAENTRFLSTRLPFYGRGCHVFVWGAFSVRRGVSSQPFVLSLSWGRSLGRRGRRSWVKVPSVSGENKLERVRPFVVLSCKITCDNLFCKNIGGIKFLNIPICCVWWIDVDWTGHEYYCTKTSGSALRFENPVVVLPVLSKYTPKFYVFCVFKILAKGYYIFSQNSRFD